MSLPIDQVDILRRLPLNEEQMSKLLKVLTEEHEEKKKKMAEEEKENLTACRSNSCNPGSPDLVGQYCTGAEDSDTPTFGQSAASATDSSSAEYAAGPA